MRCKLMLSTVSLLVFSIILAYAQENPDEGNDGPDHHRHIRDHNEMMNKNMGHLFFVPGASVIFDNYRLKIMKVFNESRESKIKLWEKIHNLRQNIDILIGKYQSDKSVSGDIVADLKEISGIHNQVQAINMSAMKKIQELNEAREKEIKTAVDAWLYKVERDNKELDKFIDEYKNIKTNEAD